MRRADLTRDAAICTAMAADLEAYLLKDVVYWPLSTSGPRRMPYPQLTLGGLLMRLHHLEILGASHLSPESYQSYWQAQTAANAAFASWQVRFERKLLAEIAARMRPWSFYLAECSEAPVACAEDYPTQTEVRTMIALLLDSAQGVQGSSLLRSQVQGLDRRLQDMTLSSPFVWDNIFEAAYPADRFWWLYITPIR